jgi:aminomethyltransferase
MRENGDFIGADALREKIAEAGPALKRVGLKPEGRQPVRGGRRSLRRSWQHGRRVTSGGFGPSAGHPVAMGYVATPLAKPGTAKLFADVRGQRIPHRRPLSSLHATPLFQRMNFPMAKTLLH